MNSCYDITKTLGDKWFNCLLCWNFRKCFELSSNFREFRKNFRRFLKTLGKCLKTISFNDTVTSSSWLYLEACSFTEKLQICFLVDIHLFKVYNENIIAIWEICSKLTANGPERSLPYTLQTSEKVWFSNIFRGYRRRRSGVFTANFEQISHIVLVFLLLTLKK